LTAESATFPLAQSLKAGTATLGEVFSFLSGLYFRGKLAYAQTFANPPGDAPGVLVITPGAGLLPPNELMDLERLRAFASVDVSERNPAYRDPLDRDAKQLDVLMSVETEVVLLGSVATAKYIEVLNSIFGSRLKFPTEFVGRGDMSRGGLLLRCVDDQIELEYTEASSAGHRGSRPPKLPPRRSQPI